MTIQKKGERVEERDGRTGIASFTDVTIQFVYVDGFCIFAVWFGSSSNTINGYGRFFDR